MFCNTVQFSASTSSLFKHSHTPCANKVFGGHSTFDELFSVKQNEKENKLYRQFCMVMNTILKPEQNHCWTDIQVSTSTSIRADLDMWYLAFFYYFIVINISSDYN